MYGLRKLEKNVTEITRNCIETKERKLKSEKRIISSKGGQRIGRE